MKLFLLIVVFSLLTLSLSAQFYNFEVKLKNSQTMEYSVKDVEQIFFTNTGKSPTSEIQLIFYDNSQIAYNLKDIDKISFTEDNTIKAFCLNIFLTSQLIKNYNLDSISNIKFNNITSAGEEPFVMTPVMNFPNPFSDKISIQINLKNEQQLTIRFSDEKGNTVRNFDESSYPSGENTVTWDGKDNSGSPVPSGIYYFIAESKGSVIFNKMIKIR